MPEPLDVTLVEKAREMYVFGIEQDGKINFPSIPEVAILLNLSEDTIYRYSSDGKWLKERDRLIEEVFQERRKQQTKRFIQRSLKLDDVAFESNDLGIQLIKAGINQIHKGFKDGKKIKAGEIGLFVKSVGDYLKNKNTLLGFKESNGNNFNINVGGTNNSVQFEIREEDEQIMELYAQDIIDIKAKSVKDEPNIT